MLSILLIAAPAAQAAVINVIDVIPNAASNESTQNSEPSLAVNPLNPLQMVSAAFTASFSALGVVTPYWKSSNGGTTWTFYDNLNTLDKSIAWRQDGVAALTTPLFPSGSNNGINTFVTAGTTFGAPINSFNPGRHLDQPWVRTGSSGQTYVAYNDLSNAGGRTATIRVSRDNGVTYAAPVILETVNPAGGQDAPSVRMALNGSTVYGAFTRWGAVIENDANGIRFGNSQIVVVKSTNSGVSFSAGVTAATTTGLFTNTVNTPLTLGQERTSSDIAIAVDPKNANRVIVAYANAPGANGAGLLQLHVTESTDGGATWTNKFTTPTNVRAGLPALSILANGAVGLLYQLYNPATNQLSQHFLTTTDDFATTSDSLLGTETNATPAATFSPYLGDFFDLTSVDNSFYGIFSASNADNGLLASFPSVSFQRNLVGTPGNANFQLRDINGSENIAFSIDPFVFSFTIGNPPPLALLGIGLLGLAALRRHRK